MLTLAMMAAVCVSQVPDAGAKQEQRDFRRITTSSVPCKTVAECWLDGAGKPIARPKKFKGKPLPKGECSSRGLLWLRNKLSCEENVCRAEFVGDMC